MKELIIILLGAMLIDNVILSRFMGICPFLGVSGNTKSAQGISLSVATAIVLTIVITYPIRKFLSIHNLEYMQTIMFILIIAAVVQLLEMIIKRYNKTLYDMLGVYLALITTNCAVLGTVIRCTMENHDFVQSIVYGIGVSGGFALSIFIMSGIRGRINENEVPVPFRGTPIVLITAGLMAIAFSGFAGIGG
ncbi:MAG: electron transport complex subunit RsxA [Lachnospiraceae bacterium]|nr:electron transport complex subunit RsxA [Lachnospiraceae bacterium]